MQGGRKALAALLPPADPKTSSTAILRQIRRESIVEAEVSVVESYASDREICLDGLGHPITRVRVVATAWDWQLVDGEELDSR